MNSASSGYSAGLTASASHCGCIYRVHKTPDTCQGWQDDGIIFLQRIFFFLPRFSNLFRSLITSRKKSFLGITQLERNKQVFFDNRGANCKKYCSLSPKYYTLCDVKLRLRKRRTQNKQALYCVGPGCRRTALLPRGFVERESGGHPLFCFVFKAHSASAQTATHRRVAQPRQPSGPRENSDREPRA